MKTMLPETIKETTALAKTDEPGPSDLLQVIANAVADPRMDVVKMQALLDMHRQITDDNRKVAFKAALTRIQEKVPQIQKDGRIIVKGAERSRYAKLEDIGKVIRPMLAAEGFAFSFDSHSQDGKLFTITCKLSHKEGHEETKSIVLPIDASDYRSAVQSIGSTVAYGKRQLIKMHLNIIERDEDTDGNSMDLITKEQVRDLETVLHDTKSDLGGFLRFMGVDSLADIRQRDMKKAMVAIEAKRGRK